ncbi:MAG TPA: ABC transporter substrate-binding protein [Solirubrobacteraceae bacterium]|nr:ABC transporter substrate-binding protein [Solirubrobacteraceae bacterium]
MKTQGDNGSLWDMIQIYDQLVEYQPGSLDVQPGLASSWTISPDGKTYTFHLRSARFSTGAPVTAQDVKFSIDRFASPTVDSAYAGFLAAAYKSSDTPNADTFVIHLSRPDAGFLAALAVPVASITPEAIVKKEGENGFGSSPVGSGPFELAQWARGRFVKLVRNPYYWRTGRPYLDSVTINYVPNDNTRVLQVQSGQAEVAESIPYTQVANLSSQPGVSVQSAPIVAYDAIWLNNSYPPLADVNVRQALNYALDKPAINKAVYADKAAISNSTLAQTKYWSGSVAPYSYDLAKAKQLIAASKYPHGFNLSLKVPAGDSVYNSVAVIAKSEWAPLGVNVSIQPQETNSLFTAYSAGNYQAAIPQPATTSDVLVPDELALAWLVWSKGYQSYFTQYKDPAVANMVLQANEATTNAARATLWPQIQQKSMADAPWVPIVFPPSLTAVRSNVHNFSTLRSGWWDLADTWVN